MNTTSLVPEDWSLAGKGIDRATGEPFAIVARNKDGQPTTWRLQLTTNRNNRTDWRCVGHSDHLGNDVTYPSPRNLSHSQIDTVLRRFVDPGDWVSTKWVAYPSQVV